MLLRYRLSRFAGLIDAAQQRAQFLSCDLAPPYTVVFKRHRIRTFVQPFVAPFEMQVMRSQSRVLYG
jgi:hypothetical protein